MEYVIETRDLTKRYGPKTAVDNVSLRVKPGEIYGLIGKNGAGKTTLMKLLLGISFPNSGEIRLFDGMDLSRARRKTGALVEVPALYQNATAHENMERFGFLSDATREDVEKLLAFVGLQNTGKKKVKHFSLGMKQRLGIAVALLGYPELLILDEPVNGLDPAGIKEVRDVILDLNSRGLTFLISSHLLDELGKIATTYGIMANGKLVEELSAEEVREMCKTALLVATDNGPGALEILQNSCPEAEITLSGDTLRITDGAPDHTVVLRLLLDAGIHINEIKNEEMDLEGFFLERMG